MKISNSKNKATLTEFHFWVLLSSFSDCFLCDCFWIGAMPMEQRTVRPVRPTKSPWKKHKRYKKDIPTSDRTMWWSAIRLNCSLQQLEMHLYLRVTFKTEIAIIAIPGSRCVDITWNHSFLRCRLPASQGLVRLNFLRLRAVSWRPLFSMGPTFCAGHGVRSWRNRKIHEECCLFILSHQTKYTVENT